MKKSGIITLTTDFGLIDPYVAMMKGVILSINPEVRVVDISHSVKAGDITHASGLIQESCNFFPKGTIHVGVVDPGVGGDRRPILIKTVTIFSSALTMAFSGRLSAHMTMFILSISQKSDIFYLASAVHFTGVTSLPRLPRICPAT